MNSSDGDRIVVGKPNWAPLEMVLQPSDCANYMYIGRAGEIELYKHRWSRRYLNISADGRRFYRFHEGMYVEIDRQSALAHVHS